MELNVNHDKSKVLAEMSREEFEILYKVHVNIGNYDTFFQDAMIVGNEVPIENSMYMNIEELRVTLLKGQ